MSQRVTSRLLMDTLNNLLQDTKAAREEAKEFINSRTHNLKEAETRTLNLQGHLIQRMDALEQGYKRLLDAEEIEPLKVLKDLSQRVYELEQIREAQVKRVTALQAKNETIESELEAIKAQSTRRSQVEMKKSGESVKPDDHKHNG